MKTLLLLLVLASPGWQDQCRKREFACELRCGERTPGGSMERLRCYDRCRVKEWECREDADEAD